MIRDPPAEIGEREVAVPLPPKLVPRSEKSAWFWLIARSRPLHWAKPFGEKLKLSGELAEERVVHQAGAARLTTAS